MKRREFLKRTAAIGTAPFMKIHLSSEEEEFNPSQYRWNGIIEVDYAKTLEDTLPKPFLGRLFVDDVEIPVFDFEISAQYVSEEVSHLTVKGGSGQVFLKFSTSIGNQVHPSVRQIQEKAWQKLVQVHDSLEETAEFRCRANRGVVSATNPEYRGRGKIRSCSMGGIVDRVVEFQSGAKQC